MTIGIWIHTRSKNAPAVLIDRGDQRLFDEHKWYCTPMGSSRKNWRPFRLEPIGKRKNRPIYFYREITGCPAEFVVDHINGDTLDNRRENLRVCSAAENSRNCRQYGKWKGVRRTKGGDRWQSFIHMRIAPEGCDSSGRRQRFVSLGNFSTPHEAAAAYNRAALALYGDFARLNDLAERFDLYA